MQGSDVGVQDGQPLLLVADLLHVNVAGGHVFVATLNSGVLKTKLAPKKMTRLLWMERQFSINFCLFDSGNNSSMTRRAQCRVEQNYFSFESGKSCLMPISKLCSI